MTIFIVSLKKKQLSNRCFFTGFGIYLGRRGADVGEENDLEGMWFSRLGTQRKDQRGEGDGVGGMLNLNARSEP